MGLVDIRRESPMLAMASKCPSVRDGEVPPQKELSSYFEELFSSEVPRQKELSSSSEELFPNPDV